MLDALLDAGAELLDRALDAVPYVVGVLLAGFALFLIIAFSTRVWPGWCV